MAVRAAHNSALCWDRYVTDRHGHLPSRLDLVRSLARRRRRATLTRLHAGFDADEAVGKLRRRHGLVMIGEPREPGHRVVDWPVGGKARAEHGPVGER